MVRTCFRPLTGLLFFYESLDLLEYAEDTLVSVPLRGFCFFTAQNNFINPFETSSFRPLTGLLFFYSLTTIAESCDSMTTSFRPLTGLLFFYYVPDFTEVQHFVVFPSPYGAFVFLQ